MQDTPSPSDPPEVLRRLHRALVLPRVFEERMLILLRQGKLSKWFSGIGQEAIAVGATSALLPALNVEGAINAQPACLRFASLLGDGDTCADEGTPSAWTSTTTPDWPALSGVGTRTRTSGATAA